jgi:type III secretion system YscQ/HrcQ family protein
MRCEPYPFGVLPELTRAQVQALVAQRALARGLAFSDACSAAALLLGAPLELSVGLPERDPGCAHGLSAWVQLERAGAGPSTQVAGPAHIVIELPLGLAELLADRTLGGDGALGSVPSGVALDEMSLGAIAYLVARFCAALGGGFGVIGIANSAPGRRGADMCWPVMLRLGGDRATLRVYADALHAVAAPNRRPARQQLLDLPLRLWADAGRVTLKLSELQSLETGDVVVLDECGLHDEHEGFRGSLAVRVEGSGTTLYCSAGSQRLEVTAIACTHELDMSTGRRIASTPTTATASEPNAEHGAIEEHDHAHTAEYATVPPAALAVDAPIELQLELARFQLTLGELQRVAPGDVLVTGRRLGQAVTLRAAGRPFAEGELVNVEGEVGVRITRVLAD